MVKSLGDDYIRIRLVHGVGLVPIRIPHADATKTSCAELKAQAKVILQLEQHPNECIELLYNEKPLRDINGSALHDVGNFGLIDVAILQPGEAAAAKAQAAKAEAALLSKVDDVNASVDELEAQVQSGAFAGKQKQLLEALERQLFRLDEIRAPGGQKLPAQVMGARKAATRRINGVHSKYEGEHGLLLLSSSGGQLENSSGSAVVQSGSFRQK